MYGKLWMISLDKVSKQKATELIRDLHAHKWKNKEDKQKAEGLLARALW
tara:strand:- start:1195 stop:1341 length:147 start_codon:yes stop_codon:yes gene_type:complete